VFPIDKIIDALNGSLINILMIEMRAKWRNQIGFEIEKCEKLPDRPLVVGNFKLCDSRTATVARRHLSEKVFVETEAIPLAQILDHATVDRVGDDGIATLKISDHVDTG